MTIVTYRNFPETSSIDLILKACQNLRFLTCLSHTGKARKLFPHVLSTNDRKKDRSDKKKRGRRARQKRKEFGEWQRDFQQMNEREADLFSNYFFFIFFFCCWLLLSLTFAVCLCSHLFFVAVVAIAPLHDVARWHVPRTVVPFLICFFFSLL